jgi:hypothetical protein
MTEKKWTCEGVDEYLLESWGLKANRGDLRDLADHLKSCSRHPESAWMEARLAALLVEDREGLSVPLLLKQKVAALKRRLRKRASVWQVWRLRLAVAVTVLIVVVWGLVGRPKQEPTVGGAEPATFEESFFANSAQADDTVGLWVEASYTIP